jgi:hypothetical protein
MASDSSKIYYLHFLRRISAGNERFQSSTYFWLLAEVLQQNIYLNAFDPSEV